MSISTDCNAAYSSELGLDADVKLAIQTSDVSSLTSWFANGGDINRTDKNGNTLLMLLSKNWRQANA